MKILKAIQKVPAGTLLIPTIIGAIIHTFCPAILEIGDPTNVMFTSKGMMGFIGLLFFFTGTQLKLSDFKKMAKKGLPIVLFKYIVAYLLGFIVLRFIGLDGFFGISALSFVIAITSCNGALYLSIVEPYADEVDSALFGIFMAFSMPVLPMILLDSTAGGDVNYMSIVSLIVPFAFGILLGNLDNDFKKFFAQGNQVILPFIGFQFGSSINLFEAAKQIPSGLLLTVLFYILSAVPLFLFEHFVLKRSGYLSVASCSVAGVALSMPALAVAAVPAYAPYADSALAQAAVVMAITTFVTPFLTQFVIKKTHVQRKVPLEQS